MKKNTLKKLLAFILCVVMLSSVVLTSCKKEENPQTAAEYRTPFSLVITLVSEAPVSAETEKLIEDAFNAITEAKYKTRVDLRYYSEEEYYTALTTMIDKIINTDEPVTEAPSGDETTAVEEETIINEEYGYSEFKYPEIKENQVDIMYLSGAAMYSHFIESGYLAKLDTALSTGAKILNDYIFPEYLTAMKYNEITYAVPNNNIAGDYTYMLVNKELAEKYQYSAAMANWTGLSSAEAFIEDIAKYEKAVLPIFGNPQPINVHNWSYELGEENGLKTYKLVPSQFSVFGSAMPLQLAENTVLGFGKALTSSYGTQLQLIQKLKDKNYVSDKLSEGQEFAVGFVKGNEADVIDYREDYEVIVVEYPKMTPDSVYENMFGVYSNMADDTTRTNRCMEIISLMNTDVELRNIVQYGIEGVHYTIDAKTGILKRLNQDYMMDVNKTGNVLIAHAEEGIDPANIDYMRQQNVDAALYPSINVFLNPEETNFEIIEQANAISKKYADKLAACKNSEELQAVIDESRVDAEISNLNIRWVDDLPTDGLLSPYAAYYAWLKQMGYVDSE
ncbi:MAG: hypothetical protein J6D45_08260 [Clostridia bacterium]|nr:hypothetical protein [Clostridia bacterium]